MPVVHLASVYEHEIALRNRVTPQPIAAIVLTAAYDPNAQMVVTVRGKLEIAQARLDADDATSSGSVRDDRIGHGESPNAVYAVGLRRPTVNRIPACAADDRADMAAEPLEQRRNGAVRKLPSGA